MPLPIGSESVVLVRVRANVPGEASDRMLNTILTIVPLERRVGGSTRLKMITLTIPDEGSEEPRTIPLAAGPRLMLSTLTREASNTRSRLTPLTSTPGSKLRLIGIVRVSPGNPEALPAESVGEPPAAAEAGVASTKSAIRRLLRVLLFTITSNSLAVSQRYRKLQS